MKSLLGKIWRVLFFVNFGLTLTLLFPFFYILLQRNSWYPMVHKLKRIWARLIMENNVAEVRASAELRQGAHGLVDRCVELAARLVEADVAPAQIARGGRKAHDLSS